MLEIIYKTALLSIILMYLVWRFLYSPKFTNLARHKFIVESLTKRSFEELKRNQSETIEVKGRTGYAHWKSYERDNGRGLIVEFDVHRSAFPISISASEFIYIRNDDGNFIDQERESVYVANEGCDEMDGCGGVDQITFKARHTGQGAVSLIYHRVDEEAIDQFDMLRW